MTHLTTTSYVILGALTSRDWSAYELAEQVGKGLSDLWSGEVRQRYEAPKRLAELGLVTARTEPGDTKRPRTVYAITDAGREALTEWLATPPRPLAIQFEGMVRLLVADQGSIEDLRQNLQAVAEQAHESRTRYAMYAGFLLATGGTFPEKVHTMALANRFMVLHFTTIVEWATWALAEVESWDDTALPPEAYAERTAAILQMALEFAPPPVPPAPPA